MCHGTIVHEVTRKLEIQKPEIKKLEIMKFEIQKLAIQKFASHARANTRWLSP